MIRSLSGQTTIRQRKKRKKGFEKGDKKGADRFLKVIQMNDTHRGRSRKAHPYWGGQLSSMVAHWLSILGDHG